MERNLHYFWSGLTLRNFIAAGDGVDQIIGVDQAAIAFEFVRLTICGQRNARALRLDFAENLAHAGKRLHPRQIDRAIALALCLQNIFPSIFVESGRQYRQHLVAIHSRQPLQLHRRHRDTEGGQSLAPAPQDLWRAVDQGTFDIKDIGGAHATFVPRRAPELERAAQQRVQLSDIFPSSDFNAEEAAITDVRGRPNVVVKLDRRIKTALDETRLLILGSQVLFGFLFESVFQNGFETLSAASQHLLGAALALMVLSIACLIAPSMQHRIVEAGQSTRRLERAATAFAEWSLLPFAASLGLGIFVVFERVFGTATAIVTGIAGTASAGFFWFGLAWRIGDRRAGNVTANSTTTPLSTRIEQMLTEARVIIPGCQALLGFQLLAMLTQAFDQLPDSAKVMHAAGLCCVTISTILLMTPAALHRESFGGNDSELFLRLGSRCVVAATLPLALGVAAEVDVVFVKITHSATSAIAASLVLLLAMLSLWFLYPIWLRARQQRRADA